MKKALLPIAASLLTAALLVAIGLQLKSAFNPTTAVVVVFVGFLVGLLLGNYLGRTSRVNSNEEKLIRYEKELKERNERLNKAYEEISSNSLLISDFPKVGRFEMQEVVRVLLDHHRTVEGHSTNFGDSLRKMVVKALKQGPQKEGEVVSTQPAVKGEAKGGKDE